VTSSIAATTVLPVSAQCDKSVAFGDDSRA